MLHNAGGKKKPAPGPKLSYLALDMEVLKQCCWVFWCCILFFQMTILKNADLLSYVPENYISLVQKQIDAYWSVPWYLSLMAAVERALTIPFHISAAVLVYQAIKRHRIRWLILAIFWHAFVNALVVSAAQ
jgi:uncharacterized membrane protein YhfC